MHRQAGTEIREATFIYAYGPFSVHDYGWIVCNFNVQILCDERLSFYGFDNQTRGNCFEAYLVEGLIRLVNGTHAGSINLGNSGDFTFLHLLSSPGDLRAKSLGLLQH